MDEVAVKNELITNVNVKVLTVGGTGGDAFVPATVKSLALSTGSKVDQITIDGVSHGGSGGSASPVLNLSEGEYINRIEIRSGSKIDFLEFTTNKGHSIEGGGSGGDATALSNIRLLTISGRSGDMVDQLSFVYIADYL